MSRTPGVRSFVWPLLLVATISCAQGTREPSGPTPMGATFKETGTRRFDHVATDGTPVLSGWFNVSADTIVVRATSGRCSFLSRSPREGLISYGCPGATVRFDARHPVSKVWITHPVKRKRTQRICNDYVLNATGNRVCAKYGLETVEYSTMVAVRLLARVE